MKDSVIIDDGADHFAFSARICGQIPARAHDRPTVRAEAAKQGWKLVWDFFGRHVVYS